MNRCFLLKEWGIVYSRIQWFDYSTDYFYHVYKPCDLNKELDLDEVVKLGEKLEVKFNEDELFFEVCILNSVMSKLIPSESVPTKPTAPLELHSNPPVIEWIKCFEKCEVPYTCGSAKQCICGMFSV